MSSHVAAIAVVRYIAAGAKRSLDRNPRRDPFGHKAVVPARVTQSHAWSDTPPAMP